MKLDVPPHIALFHEYGERIECDREDPRLRAIEQALQGMDYDISMPVAEREVLESEDHLVLCKSVSKE